jgi:SAM-dependent methyltransferase
VDDGGFQERLNRSFWARGTTVRSYANRVLRPVEVVLLALHRDDLRGRVLELGSGGGRVTGYLAALGGEVTGLDVSPAMVAHGRATYPDVRFEVGDLRELASFGPAAFDAVFASFNVLDVLGHEERVRVVGDLHELIAPGGLLILSAHNLASAAGRPGPTRVLARNPLRVARNVALLPRRVRNRRRLRPAERTGAGYAVLNDEAHDFGLLHHYVEPDEQARELEAAGFAMVERRDLEGRLLDPGERAPWAVEVHYVARRP